MGGGLITLSSSSSCFIGLTDLDPAAFNDDPAAFNPEDDTEDGDNDDLGVVDDISDNPPIPISTSPTPPVTPVADSVDNLIPLSLTLLLGLLGLLLGLLELLFRIPWVIEYRKREDLVSALRARVLFLFCLETEGELGWLLGLLGLLRAALLLSLFSSLGDAAVDP